MRLLMVGWDSQVRALSHIAVKAITTGNEVCLVIDEKSSLYVPAMMGFNPDMVLIAAPNKNTISRISSIAVQAKTRNIPYAFYVRSLRCLDLTCISNTDVYKHCKVIFVSDDQRRRIKHRNDGPIIAPVAHAAAIIKYCKELA